MIARIAPSLMRLGAAWLALAVLGVVGLSSEAKAQHRAAGMPVVMPPHQVIACYFHRTVRCPTCRKISDYIAEAIYTGFEPQLRDGTVRMAMVDFQAPNNAALAQAYRITGPTLVLIDVYNGRVAAWKPVPKVWSLVGNKEAFFHYVQGELRAYLEGP